MSNIDTAEQRRWTEAVASVINTAIAWAKQNGWQTSTETIELSEDKLGSYQVPVLTVSSAAGRVVLEPIARWTSPGDGRIDVYGWPSLNRLMLLRKGSNWELFTEAGVRWPQPWGPATLADLAANLNAAA